MSKIKKIWEPEDDWFYESRIQLVIKESLISDGWNLLKESVTSLRETGPDLFMEKNSEKLRIEVKGWPSNNYVKGKNKGQKKKTNPAIQARHWFGEALLTLILAKCIDPKLKIAMGLPIKKTYETKWKEIEWLRDKLGLEVYWVSEQGIVPAK